MTLIAFLYLDDKLAVAEKGSTKNKSHALTLL
jgi:hypothetical protein